MRLAFIVLLLSFACKKVTPEVAEGKFSTVPLSSGEYSYDQQFSYLIEHVHEQQWHINYSAPIECISAEEKRSHLREAISAALRMWLAPLAKISDKPIVDKFTYSMKAVAGKLVNSDQSYSYILERSESEKPRLEVIFYCRYYTSYAMVRPKGSGKKIPDVHLSYPEILTDYIKDMPFSMTILVHELGHAFGLLDTYPTNTKPRIGQPASIMSSANLATKASEVTLTDDDIKGIKWLYKYYHKKDELNKTENKCFFDDYELIERERGAPACLPKHPLVTALKMAHQHEMAGNYDATEKILLNAHQMVNYPYGDPGKVNAQDEDGNTALHYVIKYAQASKHKHNVSVTSVWMYDQIPNMWARFGVSLLALQPYDVNMDNQQQCFDKQQPDCKRIDLTVKNKNGQTARQLADAEIAVAFSLLSP